MSVTLHVIWENSTLYFYVLGFYCLLWYTVPSSTQKSYHEDTR